MPSSRLPSEKHLFDVINHAHRHLSQILPDVSALYRRMQHAASDGYPSSSMGGESSQGIGDPTASKALAPPISDPVRDHVATFFDLVLQAERLLNTANGIRQHVMGIEVETQGRGSEGRYCRRCNAPLDGDSDSRGKLCGTDRKAFARAQAKEPNGLSQQTWLLRCEAEDAGSRTNVRAAG